MTFWELSRHVTDWQVCYYHLLFISVATVWMPHKLISMNWPFFLRIMWNDNHLSQDKCRSYRRGCKSYLFHSYSYICYNTQHKNYKTTEGHISFTRECVGEIWDTEYTANIKSKFLCSAYSRIYTRRYVATDCAKARLVTWWDVKQSMPILDTQTNPFVSLNFCRKQRVSNGCFLPILLYTLSKTIRPRTYVSHFEHARWDLVKSVITSSEAWSTVDISTILPNTNYA
jgi:hypothetical protein